MSIVSKIRLSLNNNKIDFMRVHKIALWLSLFSIVGSLLLIAFKGLNFGIDFAGGVLVEVKISDDKAQTYKVRDVLSAKISDIHIQESDGNILIRVAKASQDQNQLIKQIQEILEQNFKNVEYRKIDFVGPQVGSELIFNGFLALLLSFVFILIYIWIRFDWQFGLGGIFALIHDAILTLGFFAITGLEFDLASIASVLTIIGYSINDSVVIYDRIRENLRVNKKMDLNLLINSSLNSTLSRTILTASTTLISLLALILFGGEALFSFSMATFFGIAIGTYSSIYISAPILLYFDPRSKEEVKSKNL